MSEVFDIFRETDGELAPRPYACLGFPRNPFREGAGDQAADQGPFYVGHIEADITALTHWVRDIAQGSSTQPLSLVGNIGAGKTRILRFLRRHLVSLPHDRQFLAELLLLADTGYAHATVGGMIISALERTDIPWAPPSPEGSGIMPLVWAIVMAKRWPNGPRTPIAKALERARSASGAEQRELASLISRWLQRGPLTPSQATKVGLNRRIDWEGELIRVVADLLRIARDASVLGTFFLFIDQLEDLFRPTFSELRRSRILTDLRGLVDEIENGTPIGLLLSWTPDLGTTGNAFQIHVEDQFKSKYEALYSRMQRRRITLPLLKAKDAYPFAKVWIEALKDEPGFVQDDIRDMRLAMAAWESLVHSRTLMPGGGGSATPRQLLTALAEEVDKPSKECASSG